MATWGGGKCNAGGFAASNSTTYKRSVKKQFKRDMEVVNLGEPLERSEAWKEKFVMSFPK